MEKEIFDAMDELDGVHWWFRARRRIVLDVISRYLDCNGRPRFLDLGVGVGGVLAEVERLGDATGMDCSDIAIAYASERTNARLVKGEVPWDLANLDGNYDCVLMLDLLEHLDDDLDSLRQIPGLLAPRGILVLTVPAYQWLYSPRDVYHHHRRRYTKGEILSKLKASDLMPELISYYNTLLFPLAAVQRLVSKFNHEEPGLDLSMPPHIMNNLFERIFTSEKALLGRVPLPFGLSVISVSRNSGAVKSHDREGAFY